MPKILSEAEKKAIQREKEKELAVTRILQQIIPCLMCKELLMEVESEKNKDLCQQLRLC